MFKLQRLIFDAEEISFKSFINFPPQYNLENGNKMNRLQKQRNNSQFK